MTNPSHQSGLAWKKVILFPLLLLSRFGQLDRDEKLNKLNMILERVESKLDELLESVALL